ncbi:MAG: hypothetical protein ABJA67_14815 [Chthonomonadales bacterium]
MKRKLKSGTARLRTTPRAHLPPRWDEVPHQEILLEAQRAMVLRSPARAADDSRRYLLKRRLPRNDPADHMRYIEMESARIVETLRQLRDQYRSYFEERGCNPIAEMYWVVIRHGVKDWAIMALRSAAVEYIAASQVDSAMWKSLFDFSGPYNEFFSLGQAPNGAPDLHEKLKETISALLSKTGFDQIIDGGPFGRQHQTYLAKSFPGRAFLEGRETFDAVIKRRQQSWDDAKPWTEGLASLFEVTQQEVFAQFAALGEQAKEAELRFVNLSAFQRIAYTHLVSFARGKVVTEATAKNRWPKLLLALDEAGIMPDTTLQGKARETLMATRRKGLKLRTWQECYASPARVTLEDGKVRALRREVTHSIHNAAKKADYQLGKVWGRQTNSATGSKKASSALSNSRAKD